MDEPSVIGYNRQASQSVYLFWLVEAKDFAILGPVLILTLGLLDSYLSFFAAMLLCVVYLVALRAGRARGFDGHLFATISSPRRYLRPGPSEHVSVIRPDPQTLSLDL